MSGGPEPLPPEEFRGLLQRALRPWSAPPNTDLDRIALFLSELDRWRSRINLAGRLSPEELVSHAVESLAGARFLPQGARVVDIGTGGGFPGVALAIARPDLEVTWLEPREKRVAFLRHVARTIPVPNAMVIAGRHEDLPPATYAYATSRALKLDEKSLLDAPFLTPGGALVLWTTDVARLATDLGPGFRLEDSIAIPGSRRRAIGVFRKA